jgi:hypothetical protein
VVLLGQPVHSFDVHVGSAHRHSADPSLPASVHLGQVINYAVGSERLADQLAALPRLSALSTRKTIAVPVAVWRGAHRRPCILALALSPILLSHMAL